jgi:hypothetical protein
MLASSWTVFTSSASVAKRATAAAASRLRRWPNAAGGDRRSADSNHAFRRDVAEEIAVSDRTTLEGLTQFRFASTRAWQQTVETTGHLRSDMREGGFCATLFQTARNSLILNGEMSEWSIEHAWKLTPPARADAHEIPPTRFRSTTSRNIGVHPDVPVNYGVDPGFRGVCDTVLTQREFPLALDTQGRIRCRPDAHSNGARNGRRDCRARADRI